MPSVAASYHQHPPSGWEEEETERILRAAGIDSAPMDPSSMELLKKLVREQKEGTVPSSLSSSEGTAPSAAGAAGATEEPVVSTPRSLVFPPVSSVATAADASKGIYSTSEVTSSSSVRIEDGDDRKPAATTTTKDAATATMLKSPAGTGSNFSVQKQLEIQTNLLLQIQQQLHSLEQKVSRITEQQGNGSTPSASSSTETPSPVNVTTTSKTRYFKFRSGNAATTTTPTPVPSPATTTTDNASEQQEQQQQQQQPAAETTPQVARGLADQEVQQQQPEQQQESLLWRMLMAPWRGIANSKVLEIIRVFWVMSRRHVRPLDGALIFKLCFMLLVVTARMSRVHKYEQKNNKIKKSNKDDKESNPILAFLESYSYIYHNKQFYITMALMVVGFLYHTRYIQFFYQFFVTDNMAVRIWKGEQEPFENNPNNNNNNNNDDANGNNNNNDGVRGRGLPDRPGEAGVARPPGNNAAEGAGAANDGTPGTDQQGQGDGDGQEETEQPPAPPPPHPVIVLVMDILWLFASFFLSIFPMWNPEQRVAAARVEQRQREAQEAEEEEERRRREQEQEQQLG